MHVPELRGGRRPARLTNFELLPFVRAVCGPCCLEDRVVIHQGARDEHDAKVGGVTGRRITRSKEVRLHR